MSHIKGLGLLKKLDILVPHDLKKIHLVDEHVKYSDLNFDV